MTKKFICPACDKELKDIEEATLETKYVRWKLCGFNAAPFEDTLTTAILEHRTEFRCTNCGMATGDIFEFVVEDD